MTTRHHRREGCAEVTCDGSRCGAAVWPDGSAASDIDWALQFHAWTTTESGKHLCPVCATKTTGATAPAPKE